MKVNLGGDLNFTPGASELWGANANPNALSPFFINLLD